MVFLVHARFPYKSHFSLDAVWFFLSDEKIKFVSFEHFKAAKMIYSIMMLNDNLFNPVITYGVGFTQ